MSTFHDRIQRLTSDLEQQTTSTSPLGHVIDTFRYWLHLPNPGPVYTVLAGVVANRVPGDAVWPLLVGPPGGGKTEVIQSIAGLPEVHFAATLTEAALLSGTPKREKAANATGGLLSQVGAYGIIVCKDFTSVLAMNRDSRGQVLAALREVYDGAWTRLVGTDGGRTLHWSGKVGLIAGCTPTIDRHHAVMGAMGERFVLYRLPIEDAYELAARSLAHVGREGEMRADLRRAVCELLDGLRLPERPPTTPTGDVPRLVNLATLAVRCRSAVERDSYSREIELIPDAEAPTRLVNVLARMLLAYRIIGVDDGEAWRLTAKLALDSMPAIRRAVIEHLYPIDGADTTTNVATECGYPHRTAERALEDLNAHGVCKRTKKGQANQWELASWARKQYAEATSPENPPPRVRGELKDVETPSGLSGEVIEDGAS